MVLKKLDNRLRVLIENGITEGHRTMFVIVGQKAKDQVWMTCADTPALNLMTICCTKRWLYCTKCSPNV